MQNVSFIHRRDGYIHCRETGDTYYVALVRGVRCGFMAMCNGEPLGLEPSRTRALAHIEQHARLEFLSAQAACGQYAA